MEKDPKQVRAMFDRIARRYRFMNAVMTFGRDGALRRRLLRWADLPEAGALLDLATGTGEILEEAQRLRPHLDLTGLDFSPGMLEVARARPNLAGAELRPGDALDLPFGDESFDRVTSGYLIRNVSDLDRCFAEQYRVLKSGGWAACLDTTPPRGPLAPFIRLYLRIGIPLLGRIFAGDKAAYTYLERSTEEFETAEAVAAAMERAGFVDVGFERRLFGTMAIHRGRKP